MDFYKLSNDSKALLDEIINAENPTELLQMKFESASKKDADLLRSNLRELNEQAYISIPRWCDNRPGYVVINNSARTYEKRLQEYEKSLSLRNDYSRCNDNSISIGNGNTIKNSYIFTGNINPFPSKTDRKSLFDKHPVIISTLISLIVGFILLFSFWEKIVSWIEGLF